MDGSRAYAVFFIIIAACTFVCYVLFGWPLSAWLKGTGVILVGCALLGFGEGRLWGRGERLQIDRPPVARTPNVDDDYDWDLPDQTWAFIHAMELFEAAGVLIVRNGSSKGRWN